MRSVPSRIYGIWTEHYKCDLNGHHLWRCVTSSSNCFENKAENAKMISRVFSVVPRNPVKQHKNKSEPEMQSSFYYCGSEHPIDDKMDGKK